ncbi:MAG: M20 family metallopeptidase [Betaproteobacteria bacterium]|nr:M20 family metallopeptidase [Betaproteobacteria bacterium]MDE2003184.1 M20 family metallopeptidase [Betaproteobacteria bacterium]MDE2208988.1 M20 family metallopeptidase [Betaproteobacteria bacterium]
MTMSPAAQRISRQWDDEIVPQLIDYIRIPAKSPHFDSAWESNGHIERVIRLAEAWVRAQPIAGLTVEILRLPHRTPVLLFQVPGAGDKTVLLYGHLDKQPEMTGWRSDGGPWMPILENGKLYGRGGADDGYAVFAALSAIGALEAQRLPHAPCIGLIEACEESGSYDLPAYLALLKPRLGDVDLVVGLDSGCGDYERLWATTSLRGLAAGTLVVEVLTEGVHSGDASGVVPSSFRIARKLLDRLEDSANGWILPSTFHAQIPLERVEQAAKAAAILGDIVFRKYPFAGGTQPMVDDGGEALLNRTWRPALSVVGADGLPAIASAGNVLRPSTALKLSLRLPPTVDGHEATAALKALLETDPPHAAKVTFTPDQGATGWNAPPTKAWLSHALQRASQAHYGKPAAAMGEGGTIPFMGMLGEHFPQAQFLITGVLGPHSNAHGPNEFLHVEYAKRLTACVADVIASHASAR